MTIPTFAYFYLIGLAIAVPLFLFAYATRHDRGDQRPRRGR